MLYLQWIFIKVACEIARPCGNSNIRANTPDCNFSCATAYPAGCSIAAKCWWRTGEIRSSRCQGCEISTSETFLKARSGTDPGEKSVQAQRRPQRQKCTTGFKSVEQMQPHETAMSWTKLEGPKEKQKGVDQTRMEEKMWRWRIMNDDARWEMTNEVVDAWWLTMRIW